MSSWEYESAFFLQSQSAKCVSICISHSCDCVCMGQHKERISNICPSSYGYNNNGKGLPLFPVYLSTNLMAYSNAYLKGNIFKEDICTIQHISKKHMYNTAHSEYHSYELYFQWSNFYITNCHEISVTLGDIFLHYMHMHLT